MAQPSARYPCAQPAAPSGLRVLLVEDDHDCAFLLARLLARMGHEVYFATDGASALAEALTHVPEVVLLDIDLPDMDGYELATRLRGNPGRQRLRIIALSGALCDEQRQRRAGIDLYLEKPIEPEELGHVLERFAPAPHHV